MHRQRCYPLSFIFLLFVFLTGALCSPLVTTTNQALRNRQLSTGSPVSPIGESPLSSPLPGDTTASSQSSYSDGGGSGFNAPAVLWIILTSLLGLPLAFAGVRGWRITSGAGLGLLISFFVWVAFVNTTSGASLAANPVTSDLFLSLFVWGCFLLGVVLGSLRIGILAGVCSLGAAGGVATAILIALLRPGLLVPIYAINVVPIGILGAAGAVWPIWQQRLAVIVTSSACGSFFIGLAVDLILNKQNGISQGIRYLLDRNGVHIVATLRDGYNPSLSTWIIVGVSIGLIPIFSFIQHKAFKQPFDRTPASLEAYHRAVHGSPILGPGDPDYVPPQDKDEKFTVAPQHVRMRFPSIIPSTPGAVDPRYTAQQEAMRAEKAAMEARYPGAKPSPSPGIGRITLVPGQAWGAVKRMSSAFASAPKRMSNAFVGGLGAVAATPKRVSAAWRYGGNSFERRASAMSVPSVYSVATTGPGLQPQQQSQSNANRREYDNSRWFTAGTTQFTPVRPLQLPNRQLQQQQQQQQQRAAAAAPPSSYAPSMRSNGSSANRPKPPPLASLKTNNRNGWGANGLPPSSNDRPDLGYYGISPTTPRGPTSNADKVANSTSPKGNRLKPAARYNLL
ncbi:hypothetical protein M408DRAFT_327562 [Serendipita vermifera MAFF 305830]|uniref:TM7S3/TM198-like domain-containing protein n=1 Tax=Serendipita vermifera MAFF 305830 TaxID=933852 RepID=A0A0C3B3A4_SERVB|nr:hypothetical protein M408DRAFT_327562 [Serendipita vermifera MAFF 305830]